MSNQSTQIDRRTLIQNALAKIDKLEAELSAVERAKQEPMAIVGMGCRFPGGANSPEAYWRLLQNGVDTIREMTSDRWPNYRRMGSETWYGSFLDDIDQFDPQFFGISPREASTMDPQQRLVLEVTWEALERAGIAPDSLRGSQTSIFVGITTNEYAFMNMMGDPAELDAYKATGGALNVTPGRVAYTLGLQGPSMAIDTACSSSLVAIHLACQSLRIRESDMALAGGVNVLLRPEPFICFSRWGMMASDGRCKTFDARADGFVRGEGCGIIVLKRLTDALADGDAILALIRGSAVNQDGRTSGLTVPNGLSQQAVIRRALANANVTPEEIGYVEAHGTGTSLGDPIEVEAIGAALCDGRKPDMPPLFLSSVKTNIGHLESASGVAGLMKVVLALQHQEIPRHLHLQELNPAIPWPNFPLEIPTLARRWPGINGQRLAGVSSFGFSGTNAHVILAQAPETEETKPQAQRPVHLLTLSARDKTALTQLAVRIADHLSNHSELSPVDVAFTANEGRAHFTQRLAVVGTSTLALGESVAAFAAGQEASTLVSGSVNDIQPQVAFLFTGQGSQYVNMGRQLFETAPVFRKAMERCDEILGALLDRSLLSIIYPTAETAFDVALIDQTQYTQPALFVIEYALAQLWKSWGIVPAAVMGHSIGEYVAACVAGAICLEDGLKLVAERGRLVQTLARGGEMAAVFAEEKKVRDALKGREDELAIAAINGPESFVVSGAGQALKEVLEQLGKEGIGSQKLAVSHAFHSPLMEPILKEFEQVAAQVTCEEARIPWISNVNGEMRRTVDARYWVRHLREAVRFEESMRTLQKQGLNIYLEIGPSATLVGMARHCIEGEALWLTTLRKGRGDWEHVLESLAELYVHGVKVDWQGFDRPYRRGKVELPTYPFHRKSYWVSKKTHFFPNYLKAGSLHPLLDRCTRSPLVKEVIFESRLSTARCFYFADHRVHGLIVLPLTGFLEIVLAAARTGFDNGCHGLERIVVCRPLLLSDREERIIQVVITPDSEGASFQLISVDPAEEEHKDAWQVHVTGKVSIGTTGPSAESGTEMLKMAQLRCQEEISVGAYYHQLSEQGLQFGPCFRNIEKLWRCDGEALGQIGLAPELLLENEEYQLHPALLDACLQVFGAARSSDGEQAVDSNTYLPFSLERYRVYKKPVGRLWSHVRIRSDQVQNNKTFVGDVTVLDVDGSPVAELSGLASKRASAEALRCVTDENVANWFYRVTWKPHPLVAVDGAVPAPGHPRDSRENRASHLHLSSRLLPTPEGSYLIFEDAAGVGAKLRSMLAARGQNCVLVHADEKYATLDEGHFKIDPARPEDFSRLMGEVLDNGASFCRGVVHLWNLDAHASNGAELKSLCRAHVIGTASLLHLVQALVKTGRTASRLWVVTQGAQQLNSESVNLAQSPAWGLGKVVAVEHPELHCTRIDLDPTIMTNAPSAIAGEIQRLFEEIWSADQEDQVAFRDGLRFVARLMPYSETVKISSCPMLVAGEMDHSDDRLELKITTPGVLDDLKYEAVARREPGAGEVEISVDATGLNFRDLLNALGMYPGDGGALGSECAGTVVAVGKGVSGFKIGDAVVALAPGAFSNFVVTRSELVVYKPNNVTFAEAATIPNAFLTAHYTLVHLAHLTAGDKVLIHSAAGGVGLAAVQIAQRIGAEIFATAGSAEKRDFLKSLGVQHVLHSRSLDFAREIIQITDGLGVDVVLNSLNGEFIPKGLSVLSEKGRFLEIGKRDVWDQHRVAQFKKIGAYHVVDLGEISRDDPRFIGSMLRDVVESIKNGSLKPLPLRVFSATDVVSAFRHMQQAKHIGKIVIVSGNAAVQTIPASHPGRNETKTASRMSFGREATYLITGGLGGLGLRSAQWIAESGAGCLALMGRNAPLAEASADIAAMEKSGARVEVYRGDLADAEDVARVLDQIKQSLPPLRGIIHAAAVLDDGSLLQQNWARFTKVMAPKAYGGWLLHHLTQDLSLDFFIVYSSMASLLGSRGQGNYAAANAFLDALCRYRRAQGQPATAIQWGPWSNIGVASRRGVAELLATQGIRSITPEQGLRALKAIMNEYPVEVGVCPIYWSQYGRRLADLELPTFLSSVMHASTRGVRETATALQVPVLQRIANSPRSQWRKLLSDYAAAQARHVLGLDSSHTIDRNQPLQELGLDSLMAVELRNLLGSGLSLKGLPATLLFDFPNIEAIVDYLLRDVLQWEESAEPNRNSAKALAEQVGSISEVEQLSEEDAEVLLLRELESNGGLPNN